MPELQTLAHGEQNWDSKVNAAIDYLNKLTILNGLSQPMRVSSF